MEAAHGLPAFIAAIDAVEFGRFRAHDVRSILAVGPQGAPTCASP